MKIELKVKDSICTFYNDDFQNVLPKLEKVDLVVSDPPYAIGYSNKHVSSKDKWDDFSSSEFTSFMGNWLTSMYDILKPNGTCWFFYGFTRIREILDAIDSTKFINKLENHFVYARGKGRGAKNKLKSLREECAHLVKSEDYTWNPQEYYRKVVVPYREKGGAPRGWANDPISGDPTRWTSLGNVIPIFTSFEEVIAEERRGVVLDIGSGSRLPLSGDIYNLQFPPTPSVMSNIEKQIHSAQKSILILCMLILLSSKEGDTVLDCFGGSFSTAAACAITGRNFIGIERDKEAFEKGIDFVKNVPYDRWEKYVKSHISTGEKGGKFNFGVRSTMVKEIK